MLEESARECDAALALDPGNWQFRSCTWAFMELSKFTRAEDFIRLDAARNGPTTPRLRFFCGKAKWRKHARAVKQMPTSRHYHRDLLEACLGLRPPSELDRMAHEAETTEPAEADPETAYYQASVLAFCGKKSAAVYLLKNAISHDYCAYSQLQFDPLLVKLRGTSDYDPLLASAKQCQQRYLAGQN